MKTILFWTIAVLLTFASIQIIGQTQFVKHLNNPIFTGTAGKWDGYAVVNSCVVYNNKKYNMFYTAKRYNYDNRLLYMDIGRATSIDGMEWLKTEVNPVLGFEEKWERNGFLDVMVVFANSEWYMWYTCPIDRKISDTYLGFAKSKDGIKWEKRSEKLNFFKSKNSWDSGGIYPLNILYDGSKFVMYYKAYAKVHKNSANKKYAIGIAKSVDGIIWEKDLLNNPIIFSNDAEELDFNIKNISVVVDKNNLNAPYQMWYISNNRSVDKNDYIFRATSKDGKTWRKDNKPIMSSKENTWSRYGFHDIEMIQVNNSYKMWLSGIVKGVKTGSVIGYAEDFTNSAHCVCLECNERYNPSGGAPEEFISKVCNPSEKEMYVWGRIECVEGPESKIYEMLETDNNGNYQIEERVHCQGEKFYNFSTFLTSDPYGEKVLFDSKNFLVDKFTTVPTPKIEVVQFKNDRWNNYRGKLKISNISKSTTVLNPKVRVTKTTSSREIIMTEEHSFNNLKAGISQLCKDPIFFDIAKTSNENIELEFEIFSDDVLYWQDKLTIDVAALNATGSSELSKEFVLEQNYPNPFNPNTTIKYSIPVVGTGHAASVRLVVYDILGREVTTLVNKQQKPGNYQVQWNANGLPSGMYFLKIMAVDPLSNSGKTFVDTRKMLYLK